MTVLLIMLVAVIVLAGGGYSYSKYIARSIGEDPARITPAISKADGRDYIPTPTAVVFAHHFASIAGAGPILGPVLAITYGWAPALLWVLLGGVLIGGVHDYLATFIATREGGQSIAVVARRVLGNGAFVAVTLLIIVLLALVCSAFLNASATALTSMLPFDRIGLSRSQHLFRVIGQGSQAKVVIGGIASMSVIVITAIAPLLGWLYIKRKTPVWICSMIAIGICAVSIYIGIRLPVHLADTSVFGWLLTGQRLWMLILSAYVLVAAGVPVWVFLQSRDFINVHVLYVGMALLVVTLIKAGIGGAAAQLPDLNVARGVEVTHLPIWPGLFIIIACGATSGFHSLCAGGTTCKQITSEPSARKIGYYAMLLESFLAVCVIAVMVIGTSQGSYLKDVYPASVGVIAEGNPILGFAMAVGNTCKIAWGLPVAVGALAGMILLEGFLITTLDTAVRLTRYLIEEIWRTMFGHYDVFAGRASGPEARDQFIAGDSPTGADGIPVTLAPDSNLAPAGAVKVATGPLRWLMLAVKPYWVNSGIAVGLMLVFAFSGELKVLWPLFATSNQLLAAMVLAIASIWLLKKSRKFWFALIPSVGMLATTTASLSILFRRHIGQANPPRALIAAEVVLMVVSVTLVAYVVREIINYRRAATRAKRQEQG